MNPDNSHRPDKRSVLHVHGACSVVLIINNIIVWVPPSMFPESVQVEIADALNRCMLLVGVSSFAAFLVGLHQDNKVVFVLGIAALIGWAFAIATTYGCWPFG